MLRTVIVDDEPKSRDAMKWLVDNFADHLVEIVGMAGDIDEAVEVIMATKPDLVFLDIQLISGTGFDLLDELPAIDFEVIFATAYDQYAIEAFKVSAVDYLLKPVKVEEFLLAVKKVKSKTELPGMIDRIQVLLENGKTENKDQKKIILPLLNGFRSVRMGEIIRCESDSNYTRVFLNNKEEELVSKTLKEFEPILEPFGFMRIQRSAIINLDFVLKYVKGRGGFVLLTDGTEIEISRTKKDAFLEAFFKA